MIIFGEKNCIILVFRNKNLDFCNTLMHFRKKKNLFLTLVRIQFHKRKSKCLIHLPLFCKLWSSLFPPYTSGWIYLFIEEENPYLVKADQLHWKPLSFVQLLPSLVLIFLLGNSKDVNFTTDFWSCSVGKQFRHALPSYELQDIWISNYFEQ